MMLRSFVALVVVLSRVAEYSAFLPTLTPALTRRHSVFIIISSTSNTNDDDTGDFSSADNNRLGGGGDAGWKLANDFPLFLTQCAIQSFMVLLGSLRDPQTIRWVDNFTQPVFESQERRSRRLTGTTEATTAITSNLNPDGNSYSKLLSYHGVGAMNTTRFPTWESYFASLLEKPVEAFVIQSANGLTKDYEMEINPASICSRLVSVREQIAQEFANDLGVVANMGYHTMDSYWDYLDNQRDQEEERKASGMAGNSSTWDDNNVGGTGETRRDEVTMSSGAEGSPRRLPPHNLVFLEYSIDPLGDMAPSTLRKGNFDLLVLLATQESIHRLLNNKQHAKMENDFRMYQTYLLDFYVQRVQSHFSGIQRYSRADDFLEELLFSSPLMSTSGGSALVDPVRVTEMILNERQQVALEWQAMSKDVPNDHIRIKRLQLDRLMQSYS